MLKLARSGEDGEKVYLVLESGTRFHTTKVRAAGHNVARPAVQERRHLCAVLQIPKGGVCVGCVVDEEGVSIIMYGGQMELTSTRPASFASRHMCPMCRCCSM